jgi:mRNA-degrading endonuclease RelE of RelBE toxin-antitoxin system
MTWTVHYSREAAKQFDKLPKPVQEAMDSLTADLESGGPVRGDWPNYGKLNPITHHCHIKKGRPTYVAIWMEEPEGIQIIEVRYVGTHEKAPY